MTNSFSSPWINMPPDTQRRVEGETIHNLFWINNTSGRFGLYVSTEDFFSDRLWSISLRGIDVVRASAPTGGGRYTLLLRQNESWEIFALLCRDLVGVAQTQLSSRDLIRRMEVRLRKWQRLLAHDLSSILSVETQMGLFAELSFICDVLGARVGFVGAVQGWCGPDRGKQDFSFDSTAVEIKSYITSKGPTVLISSSHQLWSEKPNLYLAAYAISISETGQTLDELASSIRESLRDDVGALDSFDRKMIDYGYMREIHGEQLSRFMSDRVSIFRIIEGFPRVEPASLAGEITSLNYSIDLARCDRFTVAPEDFVL